MMQNDPAAASVDVVEAVTGLVRSVVEELDCELVDVQFRPEAGGLVLRLVIFNEAGIGVDDCAKVSREVSHLLDVEDVIGHPFSLEVSSPGLDWPLRSERDFARYKGRRIKVITGDSFGNKHLIGVIENVVKEHLHLATDKEILEIPISEIVRGNLVIDF
ncbi:MAG: ribosome maturation factor RimP [Thermodesulfobacteriota bacterium]|nr:ribosome maturation factor RimP [Thermodesulfobacteriota bacterium]